MQHNPVLINEMLSFLKPQHGGVYLDCTFGAGGYSKAILHADVDKLIAFDRDQNVASIAQEFSQQYASKFEFHNLPNSSIGVALKDLQGKIDGIVYDIGVSSMQIDTPSRGFSFQCDGPLDMRMDQRESLSAYEVVNNYPEAELAKIIYEYGDERKSRYIAREIALARSVSAIKTTLELVHIIQRAVGVYRDEINPATRTFQALRIEINKELEELKSSLQAAKNLLKIGGRLVVVSFHSGEDKIVKSLFNDWCGKKANSNKYSPDMALTNTVSSFKFLQKGIVIADKVEVNNNPRSRSAKLRAVEKLM